MFRKKKRSVFSRVIFWTILVLVFLLLFRNCCRNLIDDCDCSSLIKKNATIIIDPGHGGFDGGAEGLYNIVEKDINLQISLKLKDMLSCVGFKTVLIRDGDYSIEDDCTLSISGRKTSDLNNRLKFCTDYENPIFLSIHQNKFEQSNCSGTQIFYGRHDNRSEILARELQHNFQNDIDEHNKREIKKGDKNLFLLYNAKCPIVLIECGFISNPQEAKLLSDEIYQAKISFVIMKSLLNFIDKTAESTFFRFKF